MNKNLGNSDRILRVIVAVVLAVLFFTNVITGLIGAVLLAFGGILLVTSLVSFCPIYALFGFRTCRTKTGKIN